MASEETDVVGQTSTEVGEGLLQEAFMGGGNSNAAAMASEFARMHETETVLATREARFDANGVSVNDPLTENEAQLMVVPSGKRLVSMKPFIDEWRKFPERKKGCATLTDVDSFVSHVKRTATENTVIFGDTTLNAAKLLAVYDYNLAQDKSGEARHLEHRAQYAFPYSDEWLAWTMRQGEQRLMSMKEFAEFLEERVIDVVDQKTIKEAKWAGSLGEKMQLQLGIEFASPSRLIQISRHLSINVKNEFQEAVDTQGGAKNFSFKSSNTDDRGGPVSIEGGFLIRIPVFRGDAAWDIPVQLRYRTVENKLKFFYQVYRMDLHFFEAVKRTCAKVATDTGVMVLMGTPER